MSAGRRLLGIRGFLPYLTVVLVNAMIDLGHKIVIQNTVFKVYDGSTQIGLTALVNACILLPFIMFFTPAGFLADRFSKHQVMRLSFTYDHRLIDGAVAAKFVMALRDLLEKPMSIIL